MPHFDPDLVALNCDISRGGFSAERIFRVKLPDGEVYVGAAPLKYCLRKDLRPMDVNEPSPDRKLKGFILARTIRREGNGMALVAVPDGEVLIVNEETITPVSEQVST
jgi:hypothetical protein